VAGVGSHPFPFFGKEDSVLLAGGPFFSENQQNGK
jgi:hypothetical protein